MFDFFTSVVLYPVLLFAVSYLLNAENADRLLAGYNTLPAHKKKLVNIKDLVPFLNTWLRITAAITLCLSAIGWFLPSPFLYILGEISALFILPIISYIGNKKHSTLPIQWHTYLIYLTMILIGICILVFSA